MSKSKLSYYKEIQEQIENTVTMRSVFKVYDGIVFEKDSNLTCPFCGRKGAFVLRSKRCDCYKCSRSYNVFTYYEEKFGGDFFAAKISLARDFGIMPADKAEEILEKRRKEGKLVPSFSEKKIVDQEMVKRLNKQDKWNEAERQTEDVIDNVYTAMSRVSMLTEAQYKHLLTARNLTIDRIAKDYFRMPKTYINKVREEFMDTLVKDINKHYGYTVDTLIGVPGFYRDEKSKKVTMVPVSGGIAIKSRTANGKISGFQTRNYSYINADNGSYDIVVDEKVEDEDKKKKNNKYSWFSSPRRNEGVSSRTCVDVLFPPNKKMRRQLYITEGKFKAEAIVKAYLSPVISLPGVTQWKGVLDPQISYIQKNILEIKDIFICFDADIGVNLRVYNAFAGMAEEVLKNHKELNVFVLVWDERFGKGMDDAINANNDNKVKRVRIGEYLDEYKKFIEELEGKYDINGFDIYYRKTKEKVKKSELFEIYKEKVLIPLKVELKK